MEQVSQLQIAAGMPEKLVDWKNPPSLENLKQDLSDAKQVADGHKSKIEGWLKNLNEGGAPPANSPANSSKIAPKLIRKQAEWRYAALSEPFLSTDDLFNVSPVTWEDKRAAEQNQLVLNYQFNCQINKVKFIDEYVRTAVDEGTVIVKVGWEFEEVEYDGEAPVVQYQIDDTFAPTIQYLDQLKAQNLQQYEQEVPEELREAHLLSQDYGRPVKPVIIDMEKKKLSKTKKNWPTVEVCDFRNVVIDPTCKGDIKKAQFVVHSFETSISQLQKDGRYKNLEHIQIENNTASGNPDHSREGDATSNFNLTDKARKKFVVYEYWGYWDIAGDNVLVPFVAAWVGNVLIRMELNPFPDKCLPFVVVSYLPKRKSTHGEPDGALLEENQKVIGAVTRGMIDIMGKSANGQTGMQKGLLDHTNRRKFDAGQDYEFNPNVTDPRMGIFMHTYPEIPQSAQFMLQQQNQEAESLTGVKAFNEGISGASLGDVAAGIRGALDASSKRELGILRRLSDGVVQIGRKFIAMNAVWLSPKEIIRITNEQFVVVRRDDLAGDIDLKLSISTAEEDNNKAQQLAFMLQTMGNNMDPAMSRMILADIAKLRKMPDLAKRIESYQPQPDPMMQRKLQAEIALLEAEVAKMRADAVLSQAKTETEGAKAGNLAANTDKMNLDFVEQESGVTQERNKELHGEQARSQMALKAMERETAREKMQADLVKEYVKNRYLKKAA